MKRSGHPSDRGRPHEAAGRGRWLRSAFPILLTAAWVLLSFVWIWTNPIGSAPDEGDHYVRAIAAGYGEFTGSYAPPLPSDPPGTPNGRRYFTIPAGLAPAVQFACDAFHPEKSAACQDGPGVPPRSTVVLSSAASYMPTGYILPGLLMRLAADPYSALRLGRLASALTALSLLGIAAGSLWSRRRSPLALAGLLLAVTPMQIFLLTEVGPNGLEIAASICFLAVGMRLVRPGAPTGMRHWAALAYAGAILATARPTGPLWVVGGTIVLLLLGGGSVLLGNLRRTMPSALLAGAIVVAGVVANVIWQSGFHDTVHVSPSRLISSFWDGVAFVPGLFQEMIGFFGWIDTVLPTRAYLGWEVAVIALALAAVVLGTWRQRLLVILLAIGIPLACGGLTVYLTLAFGLQIVGQGVQGRYLMPMVVWFPLVCGEVLQLRWSMRRLAFAGGVTAALTILVACFQFGAWYLNSRRYAVGVGGPLLFFRGPAWSPTGGWAFWIAAAVVATALMALGGVSTLLGSTVDAETPPPPVPVPAPADAPLTDPP